MCIIMIIIRGLPGSLSSVCLICPRPELIDLSSSLLHKPSLGIINKGTGEAGGKGPSWVWQSALAWAWPRRKSRYNGACCASAHAHMRPGPAYTPARAGCGGRRPCARAPGPSSFHAPHAEVHQQSRSCRSTVSPEPGAARAQNSNTNPSGLKLRRGAVKCACVLAGSKQ